MRTSRVSRETSRLVQALSTPRRQTRSSLAAASALRNFSYSDDKVDPELSEDSSLSSAAKTEDIEDLLEEPAAKRRRRNADTPSTSISTVSTTDKRVKREVTVKTEEVTATTAKSTNPKQRRQPAKKIKREDGSVEVQPPSNWETMYGIVKKMRAANPTAPVDTMGCADLHWRTSPPKEQRFHTLIALMLSSQTKDTVTAPVMQRLHTELGPEEEQNPTSLSPSKTLIKKEEEDDDKDGIKLGSPPKKGSTLTVENIIAVSPERLNQIIWAVGFHNNKTKYIKQVAEILRDQYDSDIPSTPEELMKLPGVGPKMAYLCMSAAWGKHEGIGVDVHVHRITNLWGWHVTKNPEETRIALQSWLPRDKWHEINKLLVGLGQTACLPVGRKCGECDLAGTGLCKSEIRGMVVKTKREVKEEAKVKIETV